MRRAANAMEATIEILAFLGSCCDRFFEYLAPRVRTRSRNHLAQDRAAVYPQRPHLIRTVREIAPGWYLGTNISNDIKRSILARACEVAGISFGTDLKIDF